MTFDKLEKSVKCSGFHVLSSPTKHHHIGRRLVLNKIITSCLDFVGTTTLLKDQAINCSNSSNRYWRFIISLYRALNMHFIFTC